VLAAHSQKINCSRSIASNIPTSQASPFTDSWIPIKCYAAALTSTRPNRIHHPLGAGLFGSGLSPGCQVSARHLLINL